MNIVGLTGGSGSGKTVVSNYFLKKGYYVIDCDKIAHDIFKIGHKAYLEVVSYFGEEILDYFKNIDRKILGEIVFNDSEKLKILNKITHKYIVNEVLGLIQFATEANEHEGIVIDAPLLIEAKLEKICKFVFLIYAEYEIRLKRIRKRDKISHESAVLRLSNQKSFETLKEYADFVIYNNGSAENLYRQIEEGIMEMITA